MLGFRSPAKSAAATEKTSTSRPSQMDEEVPEIVKAPTNQTLEESSLSSASSSHGCSTSDSSVERTDKLLRRANRRLYQQKLQDNVSTLKKRIATLEQEGHQTRQLVQETEKEKRDLAFYCKHLEEQLEVCKEDRKTIKTMRTRVATLLEMRAYMEREFMNEMSDLARKYIHSERHYKNEIAERDTKVARLEEELRKYKGEEGPDQADSGDPESSELCADDDHASEQTGEKAEAEETVYLKRGRLLVLEAQAALVPDLEARLAETQTALQAYKRIEDFEKEQEDKLKQELVDASVEEEKFMSQLESLELDMSAELIELQEKLRSCKNAEMTSSREGVIYEF